MGDRGNVAIVQNKSDQVWLYSHWGGSELPDRVREGLKAGTGRFNDDSYLTKIIIGHCVPADNWQEETGYGISCRLQDNEHPIIVVDIPRQKVFTMPESKLVKFKVPTDYVGEDAKSFIEYANGC